MLHGPNKGKPDLRIKGILDDGYGSLYFITNREVTEQIAGMDLEECMRIASERMDSKVVRDIVAEKLEGKYVSATGDVFTDDYRTSMLIQSLKPLRTTSCFQAAADPRGNQKSSRAFLARPAPQNDYL